MSTKKISSKKISSLNELYLKLASDSKLPVRAALSENFDITEEVQELLVQKGGMTVFRGLAMNPGLASSVLAQLEKMQDTDEEAASFIFQGFCKNPKLPPHIIDKLIKNSSTKNSFMLLRCPSLDKKQKQAILDSMIVPDAYPQTLESAATNDALTSAQTDFLLNCSEDGVRRELARNEYISEAVQLVLAKDNAVIVRKILALNKNLTKKAELILKKDKEEDVLNNLSRRNASMGNKIADSSLDELSYKKIIEEAKLGELVKISLNVTTPLNILQQLVGLTAPNFDSWLAVALGQNPNLDENNLEKLSTSKNPEVLKAVASNPSTPLGLLNLLSKNKEPGVRAVVANKGWYELPPFLAMGCPGA